MECNVNINLSNTSFKTCGDVGIDINNKLISSVSDMTTVSEFNDIIHTELIDVKSRKTISGYPTLKLIYDRYVRSFGNGPSSSAYDYLEMGRFVKLVGDYWVDLIEQVIPSTTMWGSTYKHKNTIFDSQKFVYKKYTLKTCGVPSGVMFPSPTYGLTNLVGVEVTNITLPEYVGADCLAPTGETTYCESLYIEQINHGSEFIGTVSSMKTPSTGDTIIIPECDLEILGIDIDVIFGRKDEGDTVLIEFTPNTNNENGLTYEWDLPNLWSFVEVVGGVNNKILNLNVINEPTEPTGHYMDIYLKVTDENGCSVNQCFTITTIEGGVIATPCCTLEINSINSTYQIVDKTSSRVVFSPTTPATNNGTLPLTYHWSVISSSPVFNNWDTSVNSGEYIISKTSGLEPENGDYITVETVIIDENMCRGIITSTYTHST